MDPNAVGINFDETPIILELDSEMRFLEENTLNIRNKLYGSIKFPKKFLPELHIQSEFDYSKSIDVNDEDNEIISEIDMIENSKSLPDLGIYTLPTLSIGDEVYVVKHSIFSVWMQGIIVDINHAGTPMANGAPFMFSLVTVKIPLKMNSTLKQVNGRQVAFSEPAKVRYPVGSRVIALFKDSETISKKDAYYSGIIAESPAQANKFRYLVFFDDGYAQYVSHKHILPICERSQKVWDDVHIDSRDFIKKYLTNFPDRPMVRVENGQILKAEKNGSWWDAQVLAVDGSLVQLHFVGTNKKEWIYRGSTRLYLLYQQRQAADRRALAPGRHRPLGASRSTNSTMNSPYVEYTRPQDQDVVSISIPDDENEKPSKPQRAVAKKSTSINNVPKEEDYTPEVMEGAGSAVKSRVVYYSPKIWIHPQKLVPHQCSPQCRNTSTIPLTSLRTYNPLARPLLSAWERIMVKSKYRRVIMYRAPCGRRIRNMEELHYYLRVTGSEMSVDLFDFDHRVHCLAEFMLTKCFVSQADISHGAEAVPVPCVNYYDHSLPEFWSYNTKRQPTKGVDLNLDEGFLCACDCTDDCRDKTKCQCWQLTYEGTRVLGWKDDNVGYQYKRLLEPVPTGIYECNSRCKCAATCLNRVVQHPLQLKLQVFKTYNKGWGIRALNDIPAGCFICIYAGSLLTDAVANDGGVNDGDKYLADLDYIEVVERLKEGFEADIPDEDKDANNDNNQSKTDNEEESGNDDSNDPDAEVMNEKGDSDEEVNFPFVVKADANKEIKTRLRSRQTTRNQKANVNVNKKKAENNDKNPTGEKSNNDNKSEEKQKGTNEDLITISDDEEVVREPSRFAAPEGFDDDEYVPRHRSVRSFYGNDEACFIMDARVRGNIGRYLNHSCSPNVFVQNVFVDTHDPRFPWVAFFTGQNVRAGTELTWNYNYDVGSVPGKVIYCRCGASNCRGRLL